MILPVYNFPLLCIAPTAGARALWLQKGVELLDNRIAM